jgi:hypothetical protein
LDDQVSAQNAEFIQIRRAFGGLVSDYLAGSLGVPEDWRGVRVEFSLLLPGEGMEAEPRTRWTFERRDKETFQLEMAPDSFLRLLNRFLVELNVVPDAFWAQVLPSDDATGTADLLRQVLRRLPPEAS